MRKIIELFLNNVCSHSIIFVILMIIKVDIAISAPLYYYSTHYTKENAIAAQDKIRQQCSEAAGRFVTSPVTSGTQYDETVWRFQWQCLVCETSPAAFAVLEKEKKNCLKNCLDDSIVRCIDDGDGFFSISDCGEPILNDPRYPQCKNNAELSSSSQANNSSSSSTPSSSSFEQSSSSEEYSSSSSASGGECTGDGYTCPMSSGSSSNNTSQLICRPTIDEAEVIMAELERDCATKGGIDEYLYDYIEEYGFCIVGECNDPSSSGGSSSDSSSDSKSSSGGPGGVGQRCANVDVYNYCHCENVGISFGGIREGYAYCGHCRFDFDVPPGAIVISAWASIESRNPNCGSTVLTWPSDVVSEFWGCNGYVGTACWNYVFDPADDPNCLAHPSDPNCFGGDGDGGSGGGSSSSGDDDGVSSDSSGSTSSDSSSGGSSDSGSSTSSSAGSGGDSSSSSKSAASSSSQGSIAKYNERGPNAVYTANDIFSSGLDNMAEGKCYSLNPDRGTQYGWINNNAQDTWWWVERPCDGSIPIEPVTPGGCKNNKRGANAVYTANDCFSSGLDNMAQGKCYSLNPDRGTQYGWINNNAQDRWWWREVSCVGENDGSNGCPSAFLQKKSTFEKDSEYAEEDVSYEIWGKNTKFFYDALGRKTQADPKVRRYLFAPPKKVLNEKQNSWLLGSTSFMFKTNIDGYVDADHYANIVIQNTGISPSDPELSYANILLILRTEINDTVNQNDPDLIYHENKHIEIYNNLGNKQWNITVLFDGCSSVKEQCSEIKEKAWQEIERQFRLMIQAQNKWDDDDKKNISNHRINEEYKVKELKNILEKNYKCGN